MYRDNKHYNREYSLKLLMDDGYTKYDIVKIWPEIWMLTPEDKLKQKDTDLWMAEAPGVQ